MFISNEYETFHADMSMNNVITSVPGMRGSRKFQRGSNADNVFLVDEGIEDSQTTKSEPSSFR